MYMNFKTILLLSLTIWSTKLFGQELKYDNYNYLPDINTVMLTKNIDVYDPVPIISLNSAQTLKLVFDQISAQNEFYNYTFVHCDANWNPSELQNSEYIMGNPMGSINTFSYSTNTYQQYVHYKLVFPTEQMKLTKSGNYILKVFANFDELQLVLTRRFMILDQQTTINATINSATDVRYRKTHQEIDFEVDYTGYNIPNPFQDVKVTIMQNNSWTSAIYNLHPQFANGNILNFNYEDKNLIEGGNEFRFFDIRSLRFFSNQVINKYKDSLMNVVLMPDEPRSYKSYLNWVDYNGKRVIANKDGVNIVEDGDYAVVHFSLLTEDKSDFGEVYIYGELSDWQCKDAFRMKYDAAAGAYKASVRLKQSYYNYLYVMQDKEGKLDYTFTEGSHYETENDYTILVYHKNVFYGYDELIGVINQNSRAEE